MGRQSRRQLLRGGLALAGSAMLAGCGITPPFGQQAAKVPGVKLTTTVMFCDGGRSLTDASNTPSPPSGIVQVCGVAGFM